MAIQCNGQWSIKTPNTDISSGIATASATFTFSVNQTVTSPTNIGIFGRAVGNGPFSANIFLTNVVKPQASGAAIGGTINNTFTFTPGVVYQVTYVWAHGSQNIYINGASIVSGTSLLLTDTAISPMLIGAGATQPGLKVTMSQVAFWDGYDLRTPNTNVAVNNGVDDHINILTGDATPLTTNVPATVYWTLQGTNGATPTVGDPGLDNHLGSSGAGTGNEYVLSTITATGGGTATYVPDLVYVSPVNTEPYVTKEGLFGIYTSVAATGADAIVTSVAANPSVYVGGVLQTMVGPVYLPTTADIPFVFYEFETPVDASSVVTWTIPFAAIFTAGGSTGRVSTQTAVPNHFGQFEPIKGIGHTPFSPNPSTLKLGVNIGHEPSINYYGFNLARNAVYRFGQPSSGAGVTLDANFQPSTATPNTAFFFFYFQGVTNGLDSQLPVPAGVHSLVYDDVNAGTPGTYTTAPTGNALVAWLAAGQTNEQIGVDGIAGPPASGTGNITPVGGTAAVGQGSANVTLTTAARGMLGMTWKFAGDSSSGSYVVTGGSGTSWTISPVFGGSGGVSAAQVTASKSTYLRQVSGTTVTISYILDYPSVPNPHGYNPQLFWYFKTPTGKWAANDTITGTPTITNMWAFTPGDSLTSVFANYNGPFPTTVGNDRSDPYAISAVTRAWLTAPNGNGPACIRFMEPLMNSGSGTRELPNVFRHLPDADELDLGQHGPASDQD